MLLLKQFDTDCVSIFTITPNVVCRIIPYKRRFLTKTALLCRKIQYLFFMNRQNDVNSQMVFVKCLSTSFFLWQIGEVICVIKKSSEHVSDTR